MRRIALYLASSAALGLLLTIIGCGGSSTDSGILIEGTLTEAGGADHSRVFLKHSAGQRIENVLICALGECSTTDEEGQWGFVVGPDFTGGEILFTISGHGIETESAIKIPAVESEIFLDLHHVEGGRVKAQHITVDGVTSHHEDQNHSHG